MWPGREIERMTERVLEFDEVSRAGKQELGERWMGIKMNRQINDDRAVG